MLHYHPPATAGKLLFSLSLSPPSLKNSAPGGPGSCSSLLGASSFIASSRKANKPNRKEKIIPTNHNILFAHFERKPPGGSVGGTSSWVPTCASLQNRILSSRNTNMINIIPTSTRIEGDLHRADQNSLSLPTTRPLRIVGRPTHCRGIVRIVETNVAFS